MFRDRIKSILKTRDAKVILENFLSLTSLQVVGMLLPLITLPYILRVIGISNYGSIILAFSLINYFAPLTDFSFKITATRDVIIFKDHYRKLNLIYSKVMSIQLLLIVISYVVIGIVVYSYEPFYKERLIFFLTMPLLLGNTIFPDWFFQGIEKMKYITFLNLGVKLFFTVCVFLFIKTSSDFWIYPLLNSCGFLISGIIGQYIVIKNYKLRFTFLKRRMISNTIKTNFPIFLNQFLPNLYNNTSTFLLGILTNTSMVGIYDAIKKIIDLCLLLLGIISRVFFPFLNRRPDAFHKYKKLMLSFGLLLSLIPILLSKSVFWYLNIDFDGAFNVLIVLAIGIFFIALYEVFGVNYFIIKRNDKLVMYNTLISSIIGLVLSFPLIHYFGIFGAAVNLTFSRFIMGMGLFILYRRTLNADMV